MAPVIGPTIRRARRPPTFMPDHPIVEALVGRPTTRGHTILLVERYVERPMVVKHEMIHALGVKDHPARPFADPCHATWATYTGLYKIGG
jgi:hypothetical protein